MADNFEIEGFFSGVDFTRFVASLVYSRTFMPLHWKDLKMEIYRLSRYLHLAVKRIAGPLIKLKILAWNVASWWLSDSLKWRATGYGRFTLMSWRRFFHLSINDLPVSPIYCFLHWLQVSIYTTLLTRQLMFSGPQKVRPVTVHVIWFAVFNSLHHVQFGFGH